MANTTNIDINSILGLSSEKSFDPSTMRKMDEQLMYECQTTINKRKSIENQKTMEEIHENHVHEFNAFMNIYESYNDNDFGNKIRLDGIFLEYVLRDLSNYDLSNIFESYFRAVQNIYEACNLRPNSMKELTESVLNESIEVQQNTFQKIVDSYLAENYFKLSNEERVNKFKDNTKTYATELISEGVDTNEAIQQAVKTCVAENFLHEVAFPKQERKAIKNLAENTNFEDIFDQNNLNNLLEQYEEIKHTCASVLALTF